MLASGQVVMARLVPNAVWELLESGDVAMSWENAIAWNETNHILKGTENYDLAMDYVEFLVDPQRQADMSLVSHNGPVNEGALDLLDPEVAANLPIPPDSIDTALFQDYAWYGKNYDSMVNAWTEWQATG
jgi:putative spermidine/putrescine transport system substrate-binding protein